MSETRSEHSTQGLLRPGTDPAPVETVNPDAASPVLLVCEHAGRAIPHRLGNLGLSADELALHIAYDIGAEEVANRLAERFGCTLVRQRYSRLVIDCNRPPGTEQSIPAVSDFVAVPGNANLSAAERAAREDEIFAPYARTCEEQTGRSDVRFAFSVHSFTPRMNGISRPWDIGFLFRHPASGGERLVDLCRSMWPELTVGHNQPYSIEDPTDWFIPACAEPRGIPHSLIEIRNDHLLTADGCETWAGRLERLIGVFMEEFDDRHA